MILGMCRTLGSSNRSALCERRALLSQRCSHADMSSMRTPNSERINVRDGRRFSFDRLCVDPQLRHVRLDQQCSINTIAADALFDCAAIDAHRVSSSSSSYNSSQNNDFVFQTRVLAGAANGTCNSCKLHLNLNASFGIHLVFLWWAARRQHGPNIFRRRYVVMCYYFSSQ